MMDNIQAIIADRQYQGALENQNATIRPYRPFQTPTEEQFQKFLDSADLSLRAILDSPIGVFEFKRYARGFSQFPVVIDFLVQFERIKALEVPGADSARDLMELALELPSVYAPHVAKLRSEFRKHFGPITFQSQQVKENFVNQRIESLDMEDEEDYIPTEENFDSQGNEVFPDSTAPKSQTGKNLNGSTYAGKGDGFGRVSFGGFMHQRRKAAIEGRESSVNTEILTPETLKIMSSQKKLELNQEKSKKVKEERKEFSNLLQQDKELDTGEGDFHDRQVEQRQKEEDERMEQKKQAVRIFSELAGILIVKAEELLQTFKEGTEEFNELIRMLWYADQKIQVNDFLMFRDLGRGAFGVVSAAKTKTTGTLTAIKCMNKKLIKGKKARRLVAAEKAILEVLGDNPSSFTIWLKYSFQDKDYFYMAIPLCTGGDMGFHLRKRHCFPEARAKFHFAEVLEGIDHLHALSIVYRDLKPENVIFDFEGHARISDLGLAMQTNGRKIRGKAGTPGYWAPEVITSQPYSYSADHWSLGCVLYEMLTGRCPFSATNTKMKDRNEATLKWQVKFPKHVVGRRDKKDVAWGFPEDAKDLILGLLSRDRTKRFGAKDVRAHPFFQELNWYKLRNKQIRPPWAPQDGQIYAPDQLDLDYQSKDKQFKKVKILPEDEIDNFDYTSKYSHQVDIVHVLETREMNKLQYDHQHDQGCCFCM